MTFPNDNDRPRYVYDDGRGSFVGISIGALFVLALIIGALVWNAGTDGSMKSALNEPATTSSPTTPPAMTPPLPSNPSPANPAPASRPPNG